jgi:hypothetical protein
VYLECCIRAYAIAGPNPETAVTQRYKYDTTRMIQYLIKWEGYPNKKSRFDNEVYKDLVRLLS